MGRILAGAVLAATLAAVAPAPAAATEACAASGVPHTTVYLPNVTKTLGGPDGWVTPFIVQNVGSAATYLELSFYSFGGGSLVTCRRVGPVYPGTSLADIPNADPDLPHDSQFSVVVRSYGAPVVSVVNEHAGTGAATESLSYVGVSAGSKRVYLPFVANTPPGGWLTTFILQNVGTATATAEVRLVPLCRDAACAAVAPVTLSRTIPPGGSQFVDPRVEPSLAPLEYAASITSDQPVAVVVNAHRGVPMSFSYNGVAAPTETTYVPYVARDADLRTTYLFVQNAGDAPARPRVQLNSFGTREAVTVVAPAPVAPGATWVFDPAVHQTPDGRSPCPADGSPACARTGEHAAVVTGGTFAVLAATHSAASGPTSGMGYTPGPRGARIYLPNVTRRLGGTSGWTTPIVLQSAGAGSATLRWYRFSDGELMATQQVPSLFAASSVRIDPRDVPELRDDEQYAVTIDATGAVTAIVTELASLGGDGAMVYEGFIAP